VWLGGMFGVSLECNQEHVMVEGSFPPPLLIINKR
jgi:hypothetical protein